MRTSSFVSPELASGGANGFRRLEVIKSRRVRRTVDPVTQRTAESVAVLVQALHEGLEEERSRVESGNQTNSRGERERGEFVERFRSAYRER